MFFFGLLRLGYFFPFIILSVVPGIIVVEMLVIYFFLYNIFTVDNVFHTITML